MSRTLTLIQIGVRFLAKDEAIVLLDTGKLKAFNRIYRGLALAFPWGEFLQLDSSLSSIADQTQYTWPSTPIFSDVQIVEIEDDDPLIEDDDLGLFTAVTFQAATETFKRIQVPPSEREWINSGKKSSQLTPDYWKMINVSGIIKLELRPVPKNSGKTINIAGLVEPTEFTQASDSTVFLQKNADDVLEHLVAADQLFRDGMTQEATAALQFASAVLQRLFKNEQITVETVKELIGA